MTEDTATRQHDSVSAGRSRWLLPAALLAALVWRIPMWANCTDSLDSDVACNGLTLQWMLEGSWRWHLPGIHYMGVTEVVLALPAAILFGASPYTLTTGPLIAYGLYMLAVYALTRRLYGERAALWSLAATAFVGPEVLFWTTFPIGGHVLITFWHLATLLLLLAYLQDGKRRWLVLLGIWSGLGLYTYQMYLYTIALVVPPVLLARGGPTRRHISLIGLALLLAGFTVGWLPHWIGKHADSWDVYGSQVSLGVENRGGWYLLWRRSGRNMHVLGDCLPKLISGQRGAQLVEAPLTGRSMSAWASVVLWGIVALLYYGGACKLRSEPGNAGAHDRAQRIVRALVALTPPLVIVGFLIHPAVINELNSRYLIYLTAWWPLALGAVMARWQPRRPRSTVVLGAAVMIVYGMLSLQWCVREGWPHQKPAASLVQYLREQDAFEYFYADYWDAYRFTFLTRERVKGVPIRPGSLGPNPQYDKLRVPAYAEPAGQAPVVGLILRREFWPRPDASAEPAMTDGDYRVYIHQRGP
jgi:hypothetical protein